MNQNQTESKPADAEQKRGEGLDETPCSPLFEDRVPEAAATQLAVVLAWLTECSLATLEEMRHLKRTSKSALARQEAICDRAVEHCRDMKVPPRGLMGRTTVRLARILRENRLSAGTTVNKGESMNNKKLCVSNMVENEQQAKVVDLPSSACSAPPEAVREWLEMELRCYRYWCVAGPAGSGWREYNIADKPKYQESRDWIEKVLGKSIECDPWKDQRILEQNIRDQEREASSESDSSNQGNPGL